MGIYHYMHGTSLVGNCNNVSVNDCANLCMVFEAAEVKAALSCARTPSPRLWPMVPKEIN